MVIKNKKIFIFFKLSFYANRMFLHCRLSNFMTVQRKLLRKLMNTINKLNIDVDHLDKIVQMFVQNNYSIVEHNNC